MHIKDFLINIPGSRTKTKTVIIQSDDWGSIRVPSLRIRDMLAEDSAIKVSDAYSRYDTLASYEDLECLFDVLTSVKDMYGNYPVLTANCLMANPDFDKIRKDDFEAYHYESFQTTFKRYNNEKALSLWKEGIRQKIFVPQFHGREHVNVPFWLHCLREDIPGVRHAFNYGVFGVGFRNLPNNQLNFQRAWDLLTPDAEAFINLSIVEGLQLFKQEFGFQSETAIAPNYTWTKSQEKLLFENKVMYLQGMLKQRLPQSHNIPYKYAYRFTSNPTVIHPGYQRRNIFFEPSITKENFSINKAIHRIDMAFKAKKPAIIGTHRINYVGVHCEKNRDTNLVVLKKLLKKIVETWPDVQFAGSSNN